MLKYNSYLLLYEEKYFFPLLFSFKYFSKDLVLVIVSSFSHLSELVFLGPNSFQRVPMKRDSSV